MKKSLLVIVCVLGANFLQAQKGWQSVLAQIEANSKKLKSLSEQLQVQKIGNRTGIYPGNPEAEFNFLRGNPAAIGNRTDFSIKQTFDFPTAYVYRDQIADIENGNAELVYKSERINLLLSAKELCIRLTCLNALAYHYAERLQNARRISDAYQRKLDMGDANIIERNKAELNLTAVTTETRRIEAERQILLSELKSMNGGVEIPFDDTAYVPSERIPDFERWFASVEGKSPGLQHAMSQIEISERRILLNRAMTLPRISAGYMMEKLVGEDFQGVTAGVSIPLWENKNLMKLARAEADASYAAAEDIRIDYYNHLKSMHNQAGILQSALDAHQISLKKSNSEALLSKALNTGEISLLEYLLEVQYYYDAVETLLLTERDLELTIARLHAVEL